jgi:hypothetical protein
LDVLLFQVAFGIGLSLAFAADTALESLPFFVSLSSVLGCLFAGPIVLGSQWLLRGRRGQLSLGEWLWLSPLLLLLVLFLLGVVGYLFFGFLELFVGFLGTLASVFTAALAAALLVSGAERDLPCYWTDRFGVYATLYTHLSVWLWVIGRNSVFSL